MISLFASLIGFISSILPEWFKIFKDNHDKKHELAILDKQIEFNKLRSKLRLEEINNFADIAETQAIYKTYSSNNKIIDALNASVRPVLAYAFFILYSAVKYAQFTALTTINFSLTERLNILWNGEDQAIFAGIISFYFGQRTMAKMRKR